MFRRQKKAVKEPVKLPAVFEGASLNLEMLEPGQAAWTSVAELSVDSERGCWISPEAKMSLEQRLFAEMRVERLAEGVKVGIPEGQSSTGPNPKLSPELCRRLFYPVLEIEQLPVFDPYKFEG